MVSMSPPAWRSVLAYVWSMSAYSLSISVLSLEQALGFISPSLSPSRSKTWSEESAALCLICKSEKFLPTWAKENGLNTPIGIGINIGNIQYINCLSPLLNKKTGSNPSCFFFYNNLVIRMFMTFISHFKTNKYSIMIGHILTMFREVIPSTYLISF